LIKKETVTNGADPSNAAVPATETGTDVEATTRATKARQAQQRAHESHSGSHLKDPKSGTGIAQHCNESLLSNVTIFLNMKCIFYFNIFQGKQKLHQTKDGKTYYKLGTSTPATVSRVLSSVNVTT